VSSVAFFLSSGLSEWPYVPMDKRTYFSRNRPSCRLRRSPSTTSCTAYARQAIYSILAFVELSVPLDYLLTTHMSTNLCPIEHYPQGLRLRQRPQYSRRPKRPSSARIRVPPAIGALTGIEPPNRRLPLLCRWINGTRAQSDRFVRKRGLVRGSRIVGCWYLRGLCRKRYHQVNERAGGNATVGNLARATCGVRQETGKLDVLASLVTVMFFASCTIRVPITAVKWEIL